MLDFDAGEDALFFSNVSVVLVHLNLEPDGLALTLDPDSKVTFAAWDDDTVAYLTDLIT